MTRYLLELSTLVSRLFEFPISEALFPLFKARAADFSSPIRLSSISTLARLSISTSSRLHLHSISPIHLTSLSTSSRLHLAHPSNPPLDFISPSSRQSISPPSRLHLDSISTPSRLQLVHPSLLVPQLLIVPPFLIVPPSLITPSISHSKHKAVVGMARWISMDSTTRYLLELSVLGSRLFECPISEDLLA